ncbi:MAG: tail fiber domain-containing protein, partial [Bacteroidia bacterium]
SDDITTASNAAGDVSGTFPTLTVDGLQGNPVANTAPTSGEVLKWNGTQWAPASDIDNNTTYTAGTGMTLSGTTFINTGDTDASDDLTNASTAGGDASGTFAALNVNGLQGNPVAGTVPSSGEVLKWNGTAWEPAIDQDAGTIYTGGAGITVSGTTIINSGDTDASDDITTATAGAGDVSGTFPTLTVDGLQGNPVANTAPTSGEVLKWNGSQWAPATDTDNNTTYTAGTGMTLSGTTFINTGDTDASDDLTTASSATGDVTGTFSTMTVEGLQGRTVANTAPSSGEVLKWNGTEWAPATDTDNNTTYTAGTGLSLSGTTFANTGDTDASDDITTATVGAGDVSGTFPTLTVDGLQGNAVAATAPASGEVLKWNGTEWAPATDDGTTYNGGTGISVSGSTITNTGDTDASDDITTATSGAGDVTGTFPTLIVDGLQGNAVAATAPASGEVLKWDGTEWAPATDDGTTYTGGTGISVSGTTIINTGDTDGSDDITTATSGAGDVSGTFPTLTVDGLQGNPIANTAPTSGEVLKWNGTQWAPANDTDNNTTYTAGTGLSLSGTTFLNTGDTDASDDITTATAAAGDVSGTFPTLTVDGLQGNPVASTTPTSGEVLSWNGTEWEPSTDANTTYAAGTGLSLLGTTFSNTGDTDASDDITTATTGAGDVSGTFPTLTVDGIQGNPVSNTAPTSGEILKWNGTQWLPSIDAIDDADADPSNEIQTLSIAGNTVSLSNGGGSVNINPYTGGTGISISGTTITNTGDTDASDDITTATSAAGDLTGTFPTLAVSSLQGNALSSSAPAGEDVLRWNGSAWTPHADTDSSETNEIQGLTIAGNLLTISAGNTVLLPTTAPTYLPGAGIDIDGSNFIINTGDRDSTDDITDATLALGDVSGTFPTLTVEALQGNGVSTSAPTTQDVLRWNGTNWTPHADTDSSETNEIQSLAISGITMSISGGNSVNLPYVGGSGIALSGATIFNTGDTDASDDITTASNAAGDVTGTYSSLTVAGLQGNPIANTAPTSGEILKWNGTQWAPSVDDNDNTTYVAGTGLALLGTTFSNTGDIDASDDITTASTAAGDVSGTFPTLTVDGLQGNPIANTAPASGEALEWNGTQWAPAVDDNTTYTAGTGIFLSGTVFSNTGDTDASDDITTATNAAGDVSGTFPTLTVDGLQGNPVANTTPTSDEVLKWNGTAWEAAADDTSTYIAGAGLALTGNTFSNTGDTDASDDITTASNAGGDASGTFDNLTVDGLQGNPVAITAPNTDEVLKWNGAAWEAAADDTATFVAGVGLALTGNSFSNTGDTDASDDITTATSGAGDVSGTFPTLTVDGLQGNPVAITAPNTDEVLKWNGAAWEAAADDTATYVAGAGLALTGNSFSNTGDTDASDDITTATAAAGDVSGTFPTLTVDGLQGTAVSATAPDQTEFLKYNGTDWAADTINSDEVLYDASVIPTTDATIDLGSSANRWRDAYVANGITVTSDMRAKTNVENLEYGMDEIMELRPVRYNWIGDASMEQKLGLIAQEMLPIIGEVVQTQEIRVNPETGDTEIVEMSLFGVNYMELLPVLIKGMQEQQETLQTQQQLLELQSKQIELLEKRLEQLENK